MDYDIISVGDHYEVHIDGEFYCSAETVAEAVEEAEKAIWGEDER